MSSTDSTTGLSQNDSRRRVTRTAIVAGWDGSGNASKVLSDNVGLAQHQIWWTSTGATAGQMTVYVRAAKSTFFVPIGTIDLSKVPNGELLVAALIDDVMFQIAGLAGTFSMDAGINSVGIDFTPTGNRSLVDRRRFQVMDVASGWNGASAITVSAEDHAGFAQHQLVVAGGIGSVKLRARPVGANTFVDLTSDVAAIPAGGALVLFPGMYDAFQLVPVGSLSGSINAQIISVGQEMFLPVTPWQVSVGLGYTPANDANVVHITGVESITGIKSFANTVGYFGGTGGATGSNASWASLNNINIAVNAEWSTGAWLSQRATVPPMLFGLTSGGAFIVQPATSAAPTAGGQAITFASPPPFQISSAGEAVQQLTGTSQWGSYRSIQSNIGVFWRFDGTTMYLMKTASGNPFGQWDTTRPFAWNIAGGISSDQPWTINNSLTYQGGSVVATGTETDLRFGYSGSVNNSYYLASGATAFSICRTNSTGGFRDVAFQIFQASGGGVTSNAQFNPGADNAFSLGGSGSRWSVVYAATGTINTSDQREKTILGPNTLGLDFVNALQVSQYKYLVKHNDVSWPEPPIDEEGNPIIEGLEPILTPMPGVRTHVGTMAQSVAAALQAAGIDPSTMGMWSLDTPTDPNSRQGLRENELMWVLWTAVQQLSSKVVAMQSDIAAIKTKIGM